MNSAPRAGRQETNEAPEARAGEMAASIMLWFLAAALAVRLIGINSASMWFDEAVSKYRAMMPLAMYATDYSDYVGPNLWEIILRPFAWGPPWLFRIPSLIAALIAVWTGWMVMERLAFSRAQRVTALVPMLLLPGMIWQAQDARYYGALAAIYIAAVYFAVSLRPLGLLGLAGILPYVHPVGAFYGAAALIVAWLAGMRLGRLVRIGLLVLLAWIPASTALIRPLGARPPFWVGPFDAPYALQQTAQAFAVGTMDPAPALLLLLLLAAALIAALVRLRHRTSRILLAASMVPLIALLAASAHTPMYFYRPVQPAVIPFCILLGWTMAPGISWHSKLGAAVGAILLVAAVVNWDPSARGGHLDDGAAYIVGHWRAGDRIAYASATTAVPFSALLADKNSCIVRGYGPDRLPSNLELPFCDNVGSWLVWPREAVMKPELTKQLQAITGDRLPVWTSVHTWQFAPIEIYYLPQ